MNLPGKRSATLGSPESAQEHLLSLEDLLAAYIQGDENSFAVLVERIGDQLFGFICRYLRDRHMAEDVYQTVLVKIATRARSYNRQAKLVTWIFRIARNACLDELRKGGRRKEVSIFSGAEREEEAQGMIAGMADGAALPEKAVIDAELGRRIMEAVEDLPDEQREVFLLKEDGEMTFDEIGETLGCGKETAKSRMRYAMRRLQNALSADARHFGLTEAD